MDQTTAIRIVSVLFAGSPPGGLSPGRVDARVLPLADTDGSGALSEAEVVSALVADRLQLDTAGQRLVPASPLTLVGDSVPLAPESVNQPPVQDSVATEQSAALPTERVAPADPGTAVLAKPLRLPLAGPHLESRPISPLFAQRPSEPLMMGPFMGRAPSANITNRGVDLTAPLLEDGSIRLGMHVDTDPTQVRQRGSMLLEESHPRYRQWQNVAGSGLSLGLDSRTRIEMTGSQIASGFAAAQSAEPMSATIRHEQRLHLERRFAVFGSLPDTTLQAGYLVGVGPWQWGGPAAAAPPERLTQYATASVSTRPHPLLGLNGELYLPIQNGAGARGAHPIARVSASVPYVTIGTTQSADTARYDVSLALTAPLGVQVAASGAVDHNRLTDRTGVTAGLQLRLPW